MLHVIYDCVNGQAIPDGKVATQVHEWINHGVLEVRIGNLTTCLLFKEAYDIGELTEENFKLSYVNRENKVVPVDINNPPDEFFDISLAYVYPH
jgi:hypothetical protein